MAETDMQSVLTELAREIGTLKVNETLLTLQLAGVQQELQVTQVDREGLKSRYAELELERNRLAARVRELEPPPATGPTPKRKRPSRAGLK